MPDYKTNLPVQLLIYFAERLHLRMYIDWLFQTVSFDCQGYPEWLLAFLSILLKLSRPGDRRITDVFHSFLRVVTPTNSFWNFYFSYKGEGAKP